LLKTPSATYAVFRMSSFKTGKIPTDALIRSVFRYKGKKDAAVILASAVGEDAALLAYGREILILTTDPVTGTASDIGWLAVHINANDVATRGGRPRWFLCDLLLPEKSNEALVKSIMRSVDKAAKRLGVAIVGGHTEVTPGLSRPIIIGYMMGVVQKKKLVTSSGARPGNVIIMTKTAGIEGTAVLAADFNHILRRKIGTRPLLRARKLQRKISVVEDARAAVRVGGVRAMHDPTEGGLLQGVWEIAEASHVGFHIHESEISILPETRRICASLNANPLRLMSSGCLLIVSERRKRDSILRSLRAHKIQARTIGTITPRNRGRKLIGLDGGVKEIVPSERDELYRLIEVYGTKSSA
jgi:hydrogenase expression/formation protein HypE